MSAELIRVGSVDELRRAGMKVVKTPSAPVLVLHHEGAFRALDNRCPHMGFPLHQGDVHDGLLDCHWHHARFDVTCGQTLDPWADDVDAYRVVIEGGDVFVDPTRPPRDHRAHGLERLARGLEDDLRLVVAKAVLELDRAGALAREAALAAARFGASERDDGWSVGLSILSAMTNVRASLGEADRSRAQVHAIARIARDCAGRPRRRPQPALAGTGRDRDGLRSWLRETVEVRDAGGAERVLAALVREHGAPAAIDACYAACTDHRYADVGHTLDYATKCAELCEGLALDPRGEDAERLVTSLVPQLSAMARMEETSAWRRPVDVAELVVRAWGDVPEAPFAAPADDGPLEDEDALVALLLSDEPAQAATELARRVACGQSPIALADAVVTASVERVLRFGTANELADWDTVHHTLTYANAVAEGMRRAPSRELFRAVLDGAMSVYLDRFLNIPAAAPPAAADVEPPEALAALLALYDGRSRVDEATGLAWTFLARGGDPRRLFATLGTVVLREDCEFHEFQELEIAWRRLERRGDHPSTHRALAACARWIAARFPTPRGREQTFDIARRLERGDKLF